MDCESRMCFCHENSYGEPFYPGNLQCHIFLCLSILSDVLALATNAGETLLSHHPLATKSTFPISKCDSFVCQKPPPASNTIIKIVLVHSPPFRIGARTCVVLVLKRSATARATWPLRWPKDGASMRRQGTWHSWAARTWEQELLKEESWKVQNIPK